MTPSPDLILDRAATNGVALDMQGAVAVVRLCRPAKRNALNDGLIEALRDVFQNLPAQARLRSSTAKAITFAPGSTCRNSKSAMPAKAFTTHAAGTWP